MQHRVLCTPLHFVIPTTIGATELLINCSPALLFRNKWGGRVDSYYRGGIQISWCYMVEASPSFSSVGNDFFLPFELQLFCFQDIPKSLPARLPLSSASHIGKLHAEWKRRELLYWAVHLALLSTACPYLG